MTILIKFNYDVKNYTGVGLIWHIFSNYGRSDFNVAGRRAATLNGPWRKMGISSLFLCILNRVECLIWSFSNVQRFMNSACLFKICNYKLKWLCRTINNQKQTNSLMMPSLTCTVECQLSREHYDIQKFLKSKIRTNFNTFINVQKIN